MPTRSCVAAAVAAACLSFPALSAAAPAGSLDPSFRGGMFTHELIEEESEGVTDHVVLADGSVVALTDVYGRIVKLRPNGTPDTTFGDQGVATVGVSLPRDLAVDAQGRLLVAGDAWQSSKWKAGVARLRPDGTPDTDFGTSGIAALEFGDGTSNYGMALTATEDGGIAVGGQRIPAGGGADFGLALLTEAGALDTSFSTDGRLVHSFGTYDTPAAIAIDDGQIALAGTASFGSVSSTVPAALKVTATGDPVPLFGSAGATVFAIPGANPSQGQFVFDMAGAPDGSLVIAGSVGAAGGGSHPYVARVGVDGELDERFGDDGARLLGADGTVMAVALQPDGRIVAAGSRRLTPGSTGADALVARLDAGGNLDGGFDGDGVRELAITPGERDDSLRSVSLLPDGRITVAGESHVTPDNDGGDDGGDGGGDGGGNDGGGGVVVAPPGGGTSPVITQPPARPRASADRTTRAKVGRARRSGRRLHGTATGSVARVELALVRRSGRRCTTLATTRVRFRRASCTKPKWLRAKGTRSWSLTLRRALPKGRYELRVRAIGTDRKRSPTVRHAFRVR